MASSQGKLSWAGLKHSYADRLASKERERAKAKAEDASDEEPYEVSSSGESSADEARPQEEK